MLRSPALAFFYVCALHIFCRCFCPTSKLFVVFGDFLSAWQHHSCRTAPLFSEWGLTVFALLPRKHDGSVFLVCFICLPAPTHTRPVRFLHGLFLCLFLAQRSPYCVKSHLTAFQRLCLETPFLAALWLLEIPDHNLLSSPLPFASFLLFSCTYFHLWKSPWEKPEKSLTK